jgi:hypothetical protein
MIVFHRANFAISGLEYLLNSLRCLGDAIQLLYATMTLSSEFSDCFYLWLGEPLHYPTTPVSLGDGDRETCFPWGPPLRHQD